MIFQHESKDITQHIDLSQLMHGEMGGLIGDLASLFGMSIGPIDLLIQVVEEVFLSLIIEKVDGDEVLPWFHPSIPKLREESIHLEQQRIGEKHALCRLAEGVAIHVEYVFVFPVFCEFTFVCLGDDLMHL